MTAQVLFEVIQKTDYELKLLQNQASLYYETRAEINSARRLLRKLKAGVLRKESSILLGNSWSFGSLRLILPAISELERHGVSVLYMPTQRVPAASRSEADAVP